VPELELYLNFDIYGTKGLITTLLTMSEVKGPREMGYLLKTIQIFVFLQKS